MASSADLSVDIIAHDHVTPTVKNIQSGIIRFVGAVSAALAATRAVVFPIEKAAEFEKELKNVQKTTGFTNGQIGILSDSLNEMSGELLASQVELAQIAATAGQLGLGREGIDSILAFTRSVAQASATFDVAADVLSNYAAQILNVFSIPTDDVERVFSTINEVSNTSVASAAKLIDIIKRVGNVAGLTVTDVTALAATTQDVGVSSEVAGTTLVKQFSRMQSEAKAFAEVMGVSTEAWTQKVKEDSLGAFKEVLLRLSQLDTAARAEGIKELFGGGRIFALASKQVADAANGFQILDRNLKNANNSYIDGQSSIREYAIIASSADGQTRQLGNAFRELAIKAGNNLLPLLKEIISDLTEFANSTGAQNFFESLSESLATTINALRATVGFLSQYELIWRNIIPLISAFIAFKLAKVLLGILVSTVAWIASTTKAAGATDSLYAKWTAVGKKLKENLVTMGLIADANAKAAAASFVGPPAPAAASRNSTAGPARSARSAQTLAETQAINAQTAAVKAQQAATAKLILSKEQVLKTQLATNRAQIAQVAEIQKTRGALALNLKLRELLLKNQIDRNAISAAGAKKELADITAIRNVTIPALDQQVVRLNRIIGANVKRVGLNAEIIAQLGIQGAQLSKNAQAAERQTRATAASAIGGAVGGGAFSSGSARRNAGAAARGLVKATTAARGFGVAIRFVGRLLSSLVLGPIGAIVLTIGTIGYTFKEQFKDFFGFVTDAQTDANARFIAREKETAKKAAQTAIEVYKNELNAAELSANIEVNLASDDDDIRNAAQEQVAERTEVLTRRLEGVTAETTQVNTILDEWTTRLGTANQELTAIDSQFKKLSERRDISVSLDTNVQTSLLDEKAVELAEKRRAITERISQIQVSRVLATEKINRLEEQQVRTQEEQKKISETIVGDIDNRTFDALNALQAQRKIEESIKAQAQIAGRLTAEKEKLDGKLIDGTASKEEVEDLLRINEELVFYTERVETLEKQLEDTTQVTGQFFSRVEGAGVGVLKLAENMTTAEIAMITSRNKAAALNNELTRSKFVVSGTTEEIKGLATKYVDLGVAIAGMDTGTRALKTIQKSLQGLQDNLVNSANFARKAIQELFADAKKIAKDAQRSFRIDTEIINDTGIRAVDTREAREVLRIEEAITDARARGDEASAKFHERRLAEARRAAAIQREGLEAQIRLRGVQEEATEAIAQKEVLEEKITENLREQEKVKDVLTNLEKADIIDPVAVQQEQAVLARLANEFVDLLAKVDSTRTEIRDFGAEANELSRATILTNGFSISGGVTSAIDIEALEGFLTLIKESDEELKQLNDSAVKTGNQSLSQTVQIIESATTKVASLQTAAKNALAELVTPKVLEDITKVADKAAALAGSLVDLGNNSTVALKLELDEVIGNDLSAILQQAVGTLKTLPPVEMDANITPTFTIGDQLSEEIQKAVTSGNPYSMQLEAGEVTSSGTATSDGAINPRKFATGGYIRGPGSGTSDSILARLSDKEYVIKAAAVRKYGVGYLHALNSMRLNNLPAFATGGQVNAASAAQALSGSTGGDETNVNLTFNGRKATLRGQKEQAREFVDMLRSVEASI